MAALEPSPDSALIIAVALPPDLERLRLRHVPDAETDGIPAHVTLLYPFAAPASIDDGVLGVLASTVSGHAAWAMTLGGFGRWPDTLYATVEPDRPVRAIQADLSAAFPSLPLYGEPSLRFEPHVTVAQGPSAEDPAVAADPGWADLPLTLQVGELALIVRQDGRWRVARAFPLSGPTTLRR